MRQLRVWWAIFIVVTSIFIISCSKPYEGTYVNEKNNNEYFELNQDGTFFIKERGLTLHGKYSVEKNILTFKFEGGVLGGVAARAEIRGRKIFDEDGKVWVKQ